MKKLNGWQAALFIAAFIAAAFGAAWLISQTAWIDGIGVPVWIALYCISILYWTLSIINSVRMRKGKQFSSGVRRIMIVLGCVTVLTYVLQIAYNL